MHNSLHVMKIHSAFMHRMQNGYRSETDFIPAQNIIHKYNENIIHIHKSFSTFCSGKNRQSEAHMFTWERVNKNPHEIAVFFFPFFWYILLLPMWNWMENRKGGFPHSVMMLMVSIYVSVWAYLLFPCVGKFVDALMKYYRCSHRTHQYNL